MGDDDARMVVPAHIKRGRATVVRWTWERIQDERRGRWENFSAQHLIRSIAVDHG